MNTTSSSLVGGRALVLGGGGATGNAWVIGVVAGLFDGGLDVHEAELTVGTSAGSTAAAQLAGAGPSELFEAVLAAPSPQRTSPQPGAAERARQRVVEQLERTGQIIASAADAADMRRRMGAAALELEAASDGSWSATWRTTVASRLPNGCWPQRSLLVTAVDAETGEPVVFDAHSGVDLVDAVAASTSSGLPYRIEDRVYIDGGYRRNENADLATGYERVLVLSPFGGRTRMPLEWRMQLAAQLEDLQAAGTRTETISPAPHFEHLFGANATDLSSRSAAAHLGHDQGRALAPHVTTFWR